MKQQNKYELLFDEFLDLIEFTLVRHQNDYNKYTDEYGYWSLMDNQDGNIGNIEGDRFLSAEQIFDRLESYIEDYIVASIIDCIVENKLDYGDRLEFLCSWEDILEYRDFLPESKWDLDVLDMIINHANEINLENCTYEEEE